MRFTITPLRKRPPAEVLLWSEPSTWDSGSVPVEGDIVSIPPGKTVVLDTTTEDLSGLMVYGTLQADPTVDVGIISNYIEVMPTGEFAIGTSAEAYTKKATITLNGPIEDFTLRSEDNGLDSEGKQRALRVMQGGKLRLFGNPPETVKTTLNAHANAGATSFTLAEEPSWNTGDTIAIAPTDFNDVQQTEFFTLSAGSFASSIWTSESLTNDRWGVLQYPTDTTVNGNAMSLTQDAFTPAVDSCPTVLDQRAEVVNLTRNIVIQSVSDAIWDASGWGAHTMVMGLNSTAQLRGVQFIRGGQERRMGRYAFHWHMLSYTQYVENGSPGGEYLGDAVDGDHFLEKCSMVHSANRAVTIHGTCGAKIFDTVAADIKGHAFFFEDGSEERNIMSGCVALNVKAPAEPMKLHDERASGFWLTNPLNKITHNIGADCVGRGLWNSFADTPFGLSRNASGADGSGLITPRFLVIDEFDDNTGHSCAETGIATSFEVTSEAGDTGNARYLQRYGDQEHRFFMHRNKIWKNRAGGYLNRVMMARYVDWTASDNDGIGFFGAALGTDTPAIMSGTLAVASSLNSVTPHNETRTRAFASYHFELAIVGVTVLNFPYVSGILSGNRQSFYGGGAIDLSDLYTDSIGIRTIRNTGWRLINSHPGYLTPPPYFDGGQLIFENEGRYWSIPAATIDHYGYWGPSGSYTLVDDPFFTHDAVTSSIAPATTHVATDHIQYGIGRFAFDTPGSVNLTDEILHMERLNLTTTSTVVGEHLLGPRADTLALENFRHFNVSKGGLYRLNVSSDPLPTSSISLRTKNFYRDDDYYILGLPFDGGFSVSGRIQSGFLSNPSVANGDLRELVASGTNLDSVINDPDGITMWHDTGNNTVWLKHKGGLIWPYAIDPAVPGDPGLLDYANNNINREQRIYIDRVV